MQVSPIQTVLIFNNRTYYYISRTVYKLHNIIRNGVFAGASIFSLVLVTLVTTGSVKTRTRDHSTLKRRYRLRWT